MNRVSYSDVLIKTKSEKVQLNESLFTDRIKTAISYYMKLIRGEKKLYSILLDPNCYPRFSDSQDLYVHIQPTLLSHEELNRWKPESLDKKMEKISKTVDKDVTHILLLDIFGRIWRIYNTENGAKAGSLLENFYGQKFIKYFGDLSADKFGVHPCFPFGWINQQMVLLQTDELGFRLTEDPRKITNKKWNEETYDMALCGGSFSAGVYSLPGETFAEVLEKEMNANNYAHKKVQIWNMAQGSLIQSVNFAHLLSTGIISKLDSVLFIDGVNDLLSTIPAESVGLNGFSAAFSTKSYLSCI